MLRKLAFMLAVMISLRAHAADKRPNFLIMFTDDQRYDTLSVVQQEQKGQGRFPWFTTPNIDRIASQGMRFRNAFVVNSLCAPSRANFLTGRYSHYNGVVNNHTPFPPENASHASLLRAAGYTTAYFGKWHCDNQRERPGFEHYASFVGQGKYIDCPIVVDGKDTPTTGWIDDVTTDRAIEFLKKQKESSKPFDMVVGFKSPHGPRTPADRAKMRFAGESIRPVPNLDDSTPYRDKPEAPNRPAKRGSEAVLSYFRCISSIDDCVGRILEALDQNGLAENTFVVFASDNGYFFGEHGLSDKRAAYEESLRIPLVVRFPKRIKAGSLCDADVLNIDYTPTILDLAGVKIPDNIQGRSWARLFDGKNDGWRDGFFYEYFYENRFKTPTIVAYRTPAAKLIVYPGHKNWTELFDLKNDPFEMKNLAGQTQSDSLEKSMQESLEKEKKHVGYFVPEFADKAPDSFN